jgi:type IV secretory pathway VirB10-like protein
MSEALNTTNDEFTWMNATMKSQCVSKVSNSMNNMLKTKVLDWETFEQLQTLHNKIAEFSDITPVSPPIQILKAQPKPAEKSYEMPQKPANSQQPREYDGANSRQPRNNSRDYNSDNSRQPRNNSRDYNSDNSRQPRNNSRDNSRNNSRDYNSDNSRQPRNNSRDNSRNNSQNNRDENARDCACGFKIRGNFPTCYKCSRMNAPQESSRPIRKTTTSIPRNTVPINDLGICDIHFEPMIDGICSFCEEKQ